MRQGSRPISRQRGTDQGGATCVHWTGGSVCSRSTAAPFQFRGNGRSCWYTEPIPGRPTRATEGLDTRRQVREGRRHQLISRTLRRQAKRAERPSARRWSSRSTDRTLARAAQRISPCSIGSGQFLRSVYSTLVRRGLVVMPGMRPRFATGRPSISLMSPVKLTGRALAM